MIAADRMSQMANAIYLHKTAEEFGLADREELEMWNQLTVEVAEIVASGEIPYFGDWFG